MGYQEERDRAIKLMWEIKQVNMAKSMALKNAVNLVLGLVKQGKVKKVDIDKVVETVLKVARRFENYFVKSVGDYEDFKTADRYMG